jgi:hypothetical protein
MPILNHFPPDGHYVETATDGVQGIVRATHSSLT